MAQFGPPEAGRWFPAWASGTGRHGGHKPAGRRLALTAPSRILPRRAVWSPMPHRAAGSRAAPLQESRALPLKAVELRHGVLCHGRRQLVGDLPAGSETVTQAAL